MLRKSSTFRKSINFFIIFLILAAVLFAVFSYISIKSNFSIVNAAVSTIKSALGNSLSSTYDKMLAGLAAAYQVVLMELAVFAAGIVSALFAINYLVNSYFHMAKIAMIDELTQVYNKRAVYLLLDKEIKRAERFKHPLSIAMLDIDHFKVYNDKNGHVEGDNLLRRFAKILQDKVRDVDIVGRYGGEEFMIIMPETSHKGASQVGEKIRKAVSDTKFKGEEKQPKGDVTVSIGLATFHGEYKNRAHLIGLADELLYKAKEAGRNQVMKAYYPSPKMRVRS